MLLETAQKVAPCAALWQTQPFLDISGSFATTADNLASVGAGNDSDRRRGLVGASDWRRG